MKIILFIILLFHIPLFAEDSLIAKKAIDNFRYLPVQHEGRIKPIDTVARYSLLMMHGSQSIIHRGESLSPIEWLLAVLMNSKESKSFKIIRIENSDLQAMLGKPPKNVDYYSIEDLEPYFTDVFKQYSQASKLEESKRESFHRAVIVLWKQIATHLSLNNTLWLSGVDTILQELQFLIDGVDNQFNTQNISLESDKKIPFETFKKRYDFLSEAANFNILYPLDNNLEGKWQSMGDGLLDGINKGTWHPAIRSYADMISFYKHNDLNMFNNSLNEYLKSLDSRSPSLSFWMKLEVAYNDFQPFLIGAFIYLSVFLFAVFSELFHSKKLKNITVFLLLIGFIIHTSGLIIRMNIEGRPPVTNIYSSAIFVGWGIVCFSLILEWFFRNCIGCIAGAISGSLSLIVAHHLTGDKDSMEVMRAVLDSNFWLSTHVVAITLGYSSTFLAGTLGCLYIIRGVFTKTLNKESSKSLVNMVYGTVCFSTLLTFTGTILGGIWADQAWGRFWGWDPKENGALLIILWDVVILHAKLGGFVKNQGLMIMVVFGNIITSFSWFGVNMLGVGLHSYGFIDGAFLNLGLFVFSQLVIIACGCMPKQYWRSYSCLF